jgi:type III pantothenate kinase
VTSAVRKTFRRDPRFVDHRHACSLETEYEPGESLGPDRIADAIAAWNLYGGPAIVVDLGTATTFSVLGVDFRFLGGVIAAGVGTMLDGLSRRAAMLPEVEPGEPATVLGRNTVAAMQSGAFFGTIGVVEEILRRLREEMSLSPACGTVVTGGYAPLIAKGLRSKAIVDPFLTLEGLRIAYDLWE